jgi:hypothetical protein
VLSELQLRHFFARHGRSLHNSQHAYHDFEAMVGAQTAASLHEWLIKHPSPYRHLHFEWFWVVRRLVCDLPQKACLLEPCPLTAEQAGRVVKFVENVQRHKQSLEMRFYIGGEAARFTPPTAWERVLLTFPADGPMTDRFWLGHIGSCLELRLLRREWGKARADLGAEAVAHLANWIQRNISLCHQTEELPEEPAPN